jgi:hypothetical protein
MIDELHLFVLLNRFQLTLILKTFHLFRLRFQSETPGVCRALILSDNYRLPLLAIIPLRVWAVGWVNYINKICEATGSSKWYLSDKIKTLYSKGY